MHAGLLLGRATHNDDETARFIARIPMPADNGFYS